MLTKAKEDRTYASVLADGKIHVTVPEGTEGAVIRKYKTTDGKEGSKNELVYSELIGTITEIAFYEGDFGRSLQVTVTDGNEKPVVLSLSTNSPYGEDMMKKLMAVDMAQKVKIVPYSFTDDKGKKRRGMTVWQKDADGKAFKVMNYFYDEKAGKNIHGYPEPKKQKKPLSTDQWKLYFGEAREFLVEKITEKFNITDTPVESVTTDDINDF